MKIIMDLDILAEAHSFARKRRETLRRFGKWYISTVSFKLALAAPACVCARASHTHAQRERERMRGTERERERSWIDNQEMTEGR